MTPSARLALGHRGLGAVTARAVRTPKGRVMKLTDTQLIILSSASRRQDGLATLPETLKAGAAKAAVTKLLGLGLLKEVRVKRDQPAWRTDEEEKPLGLKITKAGSAAIAVEEEPAQEAEANGVERSVKKQEATKANEPRSGS